MPASRSRNRTPEPPAASRGMLWALLLVGAVVVLVVAIAALPASLASRVLPKQLRAEDLSGTLWHGSAGRVSWQGRDLGALEWRLHAAALLTLSVNVDLHWVKVSCVIDGNASLQRTGFTARNIKGSGSIEDLRDLGVAPGWRGNATLDLQELRGSYSQIDAARGSLDVSGISATSVAKGAPLGSYQLLLDNDAIAADGSISAALHDTGGPAEIQAALKFVPATRTVLLSGTVKDRPDAAQALRDEIANLAQLHPRDAQGRIPVDLEFSL